ncbi:MAG: hypothetical protein HY531_01390 [Chloroflexi bacterium]|nr:hypothetical protein [Chloroflexota bacterium]
MTQGNYVPGRRPRLLDMAGLVILALSGLVFLVAIPVRGDFIDPGKDMQGFAASAVSGRFLVAWLAIGGGGVLELYGLAVLYSAMQGSTGAAWGQWGLPLAAFGTVLLVGIAAALALTAPTIGELYLQGETQVTEVAIEMFQSSVGLTLLIASGLAYIVGSLIAGIGIWRWEPLMRWAAIPFVLQSVLLTAASGYSLPLEMFGALLLAGSGGWMAYRVWSAAPF